MISVKRRHGGAVRSSSFSPDGEKILAAVHWAEKPRVEGVGNLPSVGFSRVAGMTAISLDTEHRIKPFNKDGLGARVFCCWKCIFHLRGKVTRFSSGPKLYPKPPV